MKDEVDPGYEPPLKRVESPKRQKLSKRPQIPTQFFAYHRQILGDFYLMEIVPEREKYHSGEVGTDIVLIYKPTERARPVSFNLTRLTTDEIDKMRRFYNLAFDAAEIIIRARDDVAQEAFDAGDDSFTRQYRQDGILVERKGKGVEYFKSVSKRSLGVPEGDGGRGDSEGGGRGTGPSLAEYDQGYSVTEDHWSSAHGVASIRDLGGVEPDSERLQGPGPSEAPAAPDSRGD